MPTRTTVADECSWFFDTFGYLLLKGVMDDEWLADANTAFDIFATQPERVRLVPEAVLRVNGHVWPEGSSELLKGKPAPGPAQELGEGCALPCDPLSC